MYKGKYRAQLLIAWLALLIVQPAQSQPETQPGTQPESHRVMLLHGVWVAGVWDNKFQASLTDRLYNMQDIQVELSAQFIGIDERSTPQILAHHRNHVEVMLDNRDFEFLVCTLPAACSFAETLDLNGSHLIMLSPDEATRGRVAERNDVTIILSGASGAIRGTFEHIQRLRPGTHVHLLSGNGMSDRYYRYLAESIMAELDPSIKITLHIAETARSLVETAAALNPNNDTGFILTVQGYGDAAVAYPVGSLALLGNAANAPAFVFWDAAVGIGNIVGGHVTDAAAYGEQIAGIIQQKANGVAVPRVIPGAAVSLYNAPALDFWDIDVSKLPGPVKLLNRTPPLWETNPRIMFATLLAATMMLIAITILLIFLRTSRRTSRELAIREQLATQSEARYRAVAQYSKDIIWSFDPDRLRFTYISPAVEPSSGYTTEEFLALDLREFMATKALKELSSIISGDATSAVLELDHFHRDGHHITFEHAVHILRNEAGFALQLTGVSRDISERKRQQAQEQQVAEQTRQRQKMESLGTLAAGIAHDFNNVLGVLVGLNDLLARQVSEDQASRELVDRQADATQRAQQLVRQILTFSRKSPDTLASVEIRDILARTTQHVRAVVPAGVDFQRDLPEELTGYVVGDASKLEQVITNLLTNALEAVPAEGGKVQATLSMKLVGEARICDVGALAPGNYVAIEISDNGGGIPSEQLPRLFEPFFTTKSLGSGIGLAIVHGVVTEHDGAISVTTTAGEGTTFTVYLPLVSPPVTVSRPPSSTVTPATRSLRILLIDDQEDLLAVVQNMLKVLGHSCATCKDPKQALDFIRTNESELDLVITDYSMPGMSGMQVIAHCKKHHPRLVTLLSSGYAEGVTETMIHEAGGAGLLDKPMSLDTIARAIARIADLIPEGPAPARVS